MRLGYKSKLAAAAAVLLLVTAKANAQVDPEFMLFRYNQLLFNPAYAGLENRPLIGLSGQHVNYSEYAKQQALTLTADAPVNALHGGMGILLSGNWFNHKYFGSAKRNELSAGLMYSYHILFSEYLKLGIGTQVSLRRFALNSGENVPNDYDQANVYPDADLGLWLKGKKFNIGASAKNLLQRPYLYVPYLTLDDDRRGVTKGYVFSLNSDYTFTAGSKLKISPGLLFQKVYERYYNFRYNALSINNTFIIADKFHAGASGNFYGYSGHYRTGLDYSSLTLNAGIDIAERGQLMLGYTRNRYNFPSHPIEIRLQVRL